MNEQQALASAKLILNTQLFDLEDTWSQGYEASQSALTELDNPYDKQTKAHHYWQEGWWAGTYNETPLFEVACASSQIDVNTLIEQPSLQEKPFDYKTFIRRTIQFSSVAVIAAVGLELADVAMANLGFFEVFALM